MPDPAHTPTRTGIYPHPYPGYPQVCAQGYPQGYPQLMHILVHKVIHTLSTYLSTAYPHPWHGTCYARMHPGAGQGAVGLVGHFYGGFPYVWQGLG